MFNIVFNIVFVINKMSSSLDLDLSKPFDAIEASCKPTIYANIAAKRNRIILQKKYKCKEDESCPICIDGMRDRSIIYTPCKHKFHSKCFYMMLSVGQMNSYSCPLCRCDLLFALLKLYTYSYQLDFIVINNGPAAINNLINNNGGISMNNNQEQEFVSDYDDIESIISEDDEDEGEGEVEGEVEGEGEDEGEGEGEDEDEVEVEVEDELEDGEVII